MKLGKKEKIILLMLVLFMWVQTGSAWEDHFTGDSSGDYAGETGSLSWETSGLGWLNDTASITPANYYYDGELFGSGTYTWITDSPFQGDLNRGEFFFFGSQDQFTGAPNTGGTSYFVGLYQDGAYLLKNDGVGSWTTIDGPVYPANQNYGNINITVIWNITTGDMSVYDNDDLILTGIDTDISTPGSMGAGHAFWDKYIKFDLWNYSDGTTTTPTPTPTPTPAPTTYPSRNLSQMKFDDPYSNPSFIDLLQNYSWLLIILLLAYMVIKR